MEKQFATDDHSAMLAASDTGRAFHFFDSDEKITKSASDAIGRDLIREHMPPKGFFGVHLNSMGAEEDYGFNKNADSASRRSLKLYHPTFEKFGCVFREHRNKDQKTQGVGQVKLAVYNTRMNRGELIVHVDKEKAPDMYKAARAGKELSWSMSMRLPFDRCSCCDNKARNRTVYCKHLKNQMTKFVPEFRKLAYARNEDDVKFFDISEVKNRADRIATYLSYHFPDEMDKAASLAEDLIIGGAEWAELSGRVNGVRTPFAPWEAHTLQKLAAAVDFLRGLDQDSLDVLFTSLPQTVTKEAAVTLANPDFRSVAGELANRGIVLNFRSFASIITSKSASELEEDDDFNEVEDHKIPGLIEGMNEEGDCGCSEELGDMVTPDDAGTMFSPDKDSIDSLLDSVGESLDMKPKATADRTITITIKSASVKQVSAIARPLDPYYSGLADAYGFYLVKAAHMALAAPGVSENLLLRSLAAMQLFSEQKGC